MTTAATVLPGMILPLIKWPLRVIGTLTNVEIPTCALPLYENEPLGDIWRVSTPMLVNLVELNRVGSWAMRDGEGVQKILPITGYSPYDVP